MPGKVVQSFYILGLSSPHVHAVRAGPLRPPSVAYAIEMYGWCWRKVSWSLWRPSGLVCQV